MKIPASRLPEPAITRPKDLIYAVDELPPWPRLIFLGAQHAALMSVYRVLIVVEIAVTPLRRSERRDPAAGGRANAEPSERLT